MSQTQLGGFVAYEKKSKSSDTEGKSSFLLQLKACSQPPNKPPFVSYCS